MKPLNRRTAPANPINPERILQFGKGNFLRAFAGWTVQHLNESSLDFQSSIVIVEATPRGGGDLINEQDGLYHLILEGIKEGKPTRTTQLIDCVSRCINPYKEYSAYEQLIKSPDLRIIISNTTETGIQWADRETLVMEPQPSFPGKVAALLYKRFKHFRGATEKGLIILCCELTEDNADLLKEFVLKHAQNWKLENAFIAWLNKSCAFCSTLVDRIVTGFPKESIQSIYDELSYEDQLVVVAEYYHNWVIQAPSWVQDEFPADKLGLKITFVDAEQQRQIRVQKVRILNGLHTGTMAAAYLSGFDTVREAIEDPYLGQFMKDMVAEEIVPNIPGDQDYLQKFAEKILERFFNPFIHHEWFTISLNSMSKWEARLLPSLLDALKNNGALPERITLSLAALIAFYRGKRGEDSYICKDNTDILELYAKVWGAYNAASMNLHELVQTVLAYEKNWKRDLNTVKGLTHAVTEKLRQILDDGMLATLKETK